MISWQYRLARKIIHFRIYVLLVGIGITVVFGIVLKDIKIETRLEDFLPQKHPFIQTQNKLTKIFGGLHQVSLAFTVKDGTILDERFLDKIISATEDLTLLDDVNLSRINSIASRHVKHVIANEEGFFVERLLRLPPKSTQEMAAFKQKILMNPNIYGPMVSRDLKSTLIQVDFESHAKTAYIFDSLLTLQEKYEDENTKIYIAGRPILEGWLNYYLGKMFKMILLSLFVIILVLYLTFRSKRGVILPLVDSAMPAIWGLGVMKLIGLRLDPSTALVPFIVFVLGISHSVQTMKRYYEEMTDVNMKSKHAVVNTIAHLFLPGIACVLTDGFGFLTLIAIPLATIKSMAMASGCGILANFFTSFVFTPCILSWMHRPKIVEVRRGETHKWVDHLLAKLSIFSLDKKAGTIVVVIFIILCLISLVGIHRIIIGDNTEGTSYLYPHDQYNLAEKFINQNFGGTNSYYLLVESEHSLLEAEKLAAMEAIQNHILGAVPQAGSSQSIVHAFKALNMFMLDGKREFYRLPTEDDTIAQYWFLYTLSGFPNDYDHLISKDEKSANIKFNLKDHKSSTIQATISSTQRFLNATRKLPVKFSMAGGDIGILAAVNDIIRTSIIPNALCISCLVILYLALVYRSLVAGLVLFLPLLISNLIVFALLGFRGTAITIEMLPLISLSEGLGVDTGIYILARLVDEMKLKRRTYKNTLRHTLITSGKAVFFSGFIVCSGIFVWVFSPIQFQAKLGANLCLALVLNLIISLVMVPVFVWWIKPKFIFGGVRRRFQQRIKNKIKKDKKGGNK